MHEEIFRALDSGATVITAGRRLARVLARDFHSRQVVRGSTIWNRPDVLPLDAFLERAWSQWLGLLAGESAPLLLNAAQEQMLWERIIRDSPAGESLLQIPETASRAMDTWRLVLEYRLPVDGSFEAAEDWSAFAGWSREFQRRCAANGWLEQARLADFLRGRLSVLGPVFLAGFDELTPRQADFFQSLSEYRAVEFENHAPALEQKRRRDSNDEIHSAAVWARRLLEENPETEIGVIVVPDLVRFRPKVDRAFDKVLGRGAFHLSVGPLLAEYPIVRTALLMLEFASGNLPLPRVGMLLRSPFMGGAEKEWGKRAQLDAKLRKNGIWDVSLSLLISEAGSCPQLQRVLRCVEKLLWKIPSEQTPDEWIRDIEALLEAFGWPGDRAANSTEFQTIGAWRELLLGFAKTGLITPRTSMAEAIDRLHRQAAETRFQPEDEGAPVQIMGMLEASGLRFDHLWIMGLHDEALPAPANPNPFLPLSLQRQYRLPHSSAERELEFATGLMQRLLASAPHIVASYPGTEGDRVLAPSPLLSDDSWVTDDAARPSGWIARMCEAAAFEDIIDETAPLLAQSDATGGASLFKDMAACPFRAFAKHRLAARPLEETDLGLSYRDRGTSVHRALEFIWRELGSHARLMELSAAGLEALISAGADAAVQKLGPGIGRDLEKRRLQRLLSEWLAIEKLRAEFSVRDSEVDRMVEIGGLQVHLRADRVDALPDGRDIILDYKTGQLKSHGWEGDRPDEPQLPLYCATSDRPIAGAAFACIRTGELRFRGLTAADVSLPSLAKMSIDPAIPFPAQMAEWRRVLANLAEDFRSGSARVDPKPGACDNCGLRALCRIREYEKALA